MGRSILHRKVMQNRRRNLDPSADHMMAATHYDSDAYDDYVEMRDNPPVVEPIVTLKQSELAALLARISALEAREAPSPELPVKPVLELGSDATHDAIDDGSQEQ